jgi:hypothetical protein
MLTPKFAAVAAVLVPLGLAVPVASADPLPTLSGLPAPGATLTFVPPHVGPLKVAIGPIIIGGKVINPGVNVATQGVAPAPIVFTIPPPR